MCETMQSSHRLRPAMALVRALLAPTASGDGAGERFCAPLPPSPHFSGAYEKDCSKFICSRIKKRREPRVTDLTNFFFFSRPFLHFWGGDPQDEGTRKSRWSRLGTSKIIS